MSGSLQLLSMKFMGLYHVYDEYKKEKRKTNTRAKSQSNGRACGKEFEFVKKECEEIWSRARGHLVNYSSDDEVPVRCNISLF